MRSPNVDDDGPRATPEVDLDSFAHWGPDQIAGLWDQAEDGDDGDERYHGRRRAFGGNAGWRPTAVIAAVSLLAAAGLGVVIALATGAVGGYGQIWRRVEAAGSPMVTADPSSPGTFPPQASPSGAVPTTGTPGQTTGPPTPFTPVTFEAEAGAPVVTLAGSAQVEASARASGGQLVSGLGNTGSAAPGVLSINSLVIPTAGTYRVTIHYTNTGKPNLRTAAVTVSGATPAAVTFPGAPKCCGVRHVDVTLAAGTHSITIANSESVAPSIDRIVVSRL